MFNATWGEQIRFSPDRTLAVSMVFQGLTQQASTTWQPLLTWLADRPQDYTLKAAPTIIALPGRRFWDPAFLKTLFALGKREADAVMRAMAPIRRLLPKPGAYVSEAYYFADDWQHRYCGANYERLLRIKRRYDPAGMFHGRHTVGST